MSMEVQVNEVNERLHKDYEFTRGTLGVRVNGDIDTYNAYSLGRKEESIIRAYDRKGGLLGIIDTDRKPMQFTPTLALNYSRVNYLQEQSMHPGLELGDIIVLPLEIVRNTPGFDSKHDIIIQHYQETGYMHVQCNVVIVEPGYGLHITMRGM